MREPVVPRAAPPEPRALCVADRDEHRGPPGVTRRSIDRSGARPRFCGPLRPAGARARGVGRGSTGASFGAGAAETGQGRAQRRRSDRAEQGQRFVEAAVHPRDPACRREGSSSIARRLRSMDRILEAPVELLQTVPDIGHVVAASIRRFADEPRHRVLVDRLKRAGVNMASQAPPDSSEPGPLTGKTFVLTGTLTSMTRDEAVAALERERGEGSRVGEQENQCSCGGSRCRQQAREGTATRDRNAG